MKVNLNVVIPREARLIRFLSVAIVLGVAWAFLDPFSSAAADLRRLKIATIIADGSMYADGQPVSIEGVVQQPAIKEVFDISEGVSPKIVCWQRFTLADDTGSIPAFNSFYCNVANRESITLSHGERVVVSGTLDFSGRDGKGNVLGLTLHVKEISRR